MSESTKATVGSYKGHPTITIPMEGSTYGFCFGLKKAEAVLEHIEEIRAFVASQQQKQAA